MDARQLPPGPGDSCRTMPVCDTLLATWENFSMQCRLHLRMRLLILVYGIDRT